MDNFECNLFARYYQFIYLCEVFPNKETGLANFFIEKKEQGYPRTTLKTI